MRTMPWDWNDPAIRLAGKSDSPKHIVAVIDDKPPPASIDFFLRVVCPEEPARDGPLWPTWNWLRGLSAAA